MFFKASVLLLIIASLAVVHRSNCFSVKGLVNKYVLRPIQVAAVEKERYNNAKEEHGSLDFFGRDLIRRLSNQNSKTQEIARTRFRRNTKGLDCNKTLSNGNMEDFKSNIQAIYPGTKWCGDGNISKSYNDLGTFLDTDSCCREHDLCPDNISADAVKYNLANTGLFTRSHCNCDTRFYECLKKANSFVSKSIGYTYFTVLGPQCFRQDYPIVECLQYENGKCVDYSTDLEGEQMYQWFDSPTF